MSEAISSFLSYGLLIGLGPIPILAIAMMLQTPNPAAASRNFALGWAVGVAAITALFVFLASFVPQGDSDHPSRWMGVVQLILALGLFVLAVHQWKNRPDGSEEPKVPGVLATLGNSTPARAFVVGFVLVIANFKHIMLVLPIGTLIADHGLSLPGHIVAISIFVVITSIAVGGVAIMYATTPERVQGVVDPAYNWMLRNITLVSVIVLVLVGVNLLESGIGNFW